LYTNKKKVKNDFFCSISIGILKSSGYKHP
jgi:hypothetical protein